jgi:hypothetical protein
MIGMKVIYVEHYQVRTPIAIDVADHNAAP